MPMKVVQDDLWLCDDCMLYAVNGDLTGIDYSYSGDEAEKRAKQVVRGVNSLGPHLVPDFDSETGEGMNEFMSRACDACHQPRAAGSRYRFAILGPDTKKKRGGSKESELREMRALLKKNRYDPDYAVILQEDGVSPEELERLFEKGVNESGSLERRWGMYTGKRR